MNKIRKMAYHALKKWCSSNKWDELVLNDCVFCDDAELLWTPADGLSWCKFCIVPEILCGSGDRSLFHSTYQLYEATDLYEPVKSVRLMRTGIIFLMLFKRLPKWFVKCVEKHVLELNKEYNRIDF